MGGDSTVMSFPDPICVCVCVNGRSRMQRNIQPHVVIEMQRWLGNVTEPFRTYLDGELTGHRLVVAYVVTGVAFVRRLLHGQLHVPIVVLLDGVQYPVGPGGAPSKKEKVLDSSILSLDYNKRTRVIHLS